MRELERFFHAVRFMTVLPTPQARSLEPDWLRRSAKHFPLVGVIVAVATAVVLLVAARLWPAPIPAMLAVTAGIFLTGALHEDGLADTVDALGGGRTAEARLAIMKDSRIGAFGALALALSLALRIAAVSALAPWTGAAALLGAHAGGRFAAVLVMTLQPYAGDRAAGRASYPHERPQLWEVGWAGAVTAWAVLPLVFQSGTGAVAALALGAALALWLAWRAARLVGGYTGDVLGAVEQSFEVGFFLGAAALHWG